ncbi:MAG: 2Fe-2S iron-sulfur cluster-binding protein [Actinomycetota bacterium]|jgi:NADP-reducing hydrogenase subunit HndD
MPAEPQPVGPVRRLVELTVDDRRVRVPEGSTVLRACEAAGVETPTLCWAPNLTPVNVCRLCVVEVEGSRALVPACSRPVEPDMAVTTGSERVRLSRRLVLELLASSVDLSLVADEVRRWMGEYGVDSGRFGPGSATVAQPVKVDNELYVRDYSKCILCYKCVEACGTDAQNTFAIAVAGRGFGAHIATEADVELPESACVYCGNCIGVCPTGALMPSTEHGLREAGEWAPDRQQTVRTVCPYCGVGCNLDLTVQDGRIVKAGSPADHEVSHGHLCIKGRFGFTHVE